MQKITDEQFNDLYFNGKLTKDIFKRLSLGQQQKLYDDNINLYNKLVSDDIEDLTIEGFMNTTLDQEQELYNTDKNNYYQLIEEKEQILEGRAKFINDDYKTSIDFRRKGIGKYFNDYRRNYKDNILVGKHYGTFKKSIDNLLKLDRTILLNMTKEQFIKKIDEEFKNQLRYNNVWV